MGYGQKERATDRIRRERATGQAQPATRYSRATEAASKVGQNQAKKQEVKRHDDAAYYKRKRDDRAAWLKKMGRG